jgi:HCOMODA/2-hydroxy-3-carboxy-muconic semialdehyde decarboxylase
MNPLKRAIRDLVVANRILSREGVLDAYGHVSVRHPNNRERFLLSCSRSPELVSHDDIMEFDMQSRVLGDDRRRLYSERFIHGAVYEARPDVHAVVHSHAPEVLPFSILSTPRLRPVTHSACCIGPNISIWDPQSKFGDTDLWITNQAQGRDMASLLGQDVVVLMKAHGYVAAARSLMDVVRVAIYLSLNARVLTEALRLGEVQHLTPGEIRAAGKGTEDPGIQKALLRGWQYWASRAGCADMVDEDPAAP